MSAELNEGLRAWAKGSLPDMAGVELLIRSGWAQRLHTAGWVTQDGEYMYPRVGEFLGKAKWASGGERRQLTILASLFSQGRTDDDPPTGTVLAHDLGGVDFPFIRLLQTAIAVAAGMDELGRNELPWPGEE